jgi:hypothetical protein
LAAPNAAAIARLQARGLADPALDPFGTAHAMKAMVSRMASLVFVYGVDMSFDALAEMLLQLWTSARASVDPSPAGFRGGSDDVLIRRHGDGMVKGGIDVDAKFN